MAYQHILIAIDFSEQSKQVCEKAKQMAADNQASLSICHIIEDFPITDFAYEPMLNFDLDLRQSLLESGEKQLEKIAESVSIPKERQYLELGVPDNDIVRIADEQKVDLIIIGSHGRRGIKLLLGSTANAVLHHAHCDVLAVRLKGD